MLAWDRLPTESQEAHAAFVVWLSSPRPRTRAGLEGFADAAIVKWSRDHAWSERARAWDAHVAASLLDASAERISSAGNALARRLDALLSNVLRLAEIRVSRELRQALVDGGAGPRIGELTKLMTEVFRMHRLASDRPTEIVGEDTGLPVETLEKIEALLIEAGGNASSRH